MTKKFKPAAVLLKDLYIPIYDIATQSVQYLFFLAGQDLQHLKDGLIIRDLEDLDDSKRRIKAYYVPEQHEQVEVDINFGHDLDSVLPTVEELLNGNG